jgi:serine/threonine-protein kinase HipA
MTISECYVYITLPGETSMVTAGRFRLEFSAGSNEGRGSFVYGKSYLARKNAVEIDPRELTFSNGTKNSFRQNGVFGALRDAGPDSWGRRLIDRQMMNAGLSEIDYLLKSPDDRAGALGFGLNVEPPSPLMKFNRTIDLPDLIRLANEVMSANEHKQDDDRLQVERLVKAGTSMGGMRPKATVDADGVLWLAKFPLERDRWNNPRVEHATLILARQCGIRTAESHVRTIEDRDVLFVRRFDREAVNGGYTRKRMISGLTMLGADETHDDKWSYVALAEEMRRFAPAAISKQLRELFSRMCFSCLVSNLDDHPRNHAFIADNQGWQLSPAYDITPTPSISVTTRDLAMTIGSHGRWANKENLISQSARFGINPTDAASLIDEMKEQVEQNWYSTFRSSGVSEIDCELVRSAFVYDGFGYEPSVGTHRPF